jgi:hypothetical protein
MMLGMTFIFGALGGAAGFARGRKVWPNRGSHPKKSTVLRMGIIGGVGGALIMGSIPTLCELAGLPAHHQCPGAPAHSPKVERALKPDGIKGCGSVR